MRDYVAVTYDEKRKPYTDYPMRLAIYFYRRFRMTPYQNIVDVGCGRGEFARAFSHLGMRVWAMDRSDFAKQHGYFQDYRFIQTDFDRGLAVDIRDKYADTFDFALVKSVVEHLHEPEHLIEDVRKILKPGGRIIVMTPDWQRGHDEFYCDHTHRSPFCIDAVRDLLVLAGFDHVRVERFRQLPILWKRPALSSVARLACLLPRKFAEWSYFVRWSQAVMLLGTGVK